MTESLSNNLGHQFSVELEKGIPPINRSREIVQSFRESVTHMAEPIAHGTVSDHLSSILKNKLGGIFPKGSFSPGRISVCSMKYPEGILPAYGFALRMGALTNSELSIDARRHGGKTIVQRYLEILNYSRIQGIFFEARIILAGLAFCANRRNYKGWPTLLVYNPSEQTQILELLGNRLYIAPFRSERVARTPVPTENLAIIMTPAKRHRETEKITSGHNVCIPIMPLEILELEEILRLVDAQRLQYPKPSVLQTGWGSRPTMPDFTK